MSTTSTTCSVCNDQILCAFDAGRGTFVCSDCEEEAVLRVVERRRMIGRLIVGLLVCLVVGIWLAVSQTLPPPAVHEPVDAPLKLQ